jgi:short-subunit dehydrogenase
MLLDGKRVLITGSGSGIGRALAIDAAGRGMAVALCGRRPKALAATLALLKPGPRHQIIAADITQSADRHRIVEQLLRTWRSLDILVNNAGLVEVGSVEIASDEALERTFQTNVIAPMALTRDLMPLLIAARPSRVVNIGSVFGEIPYPQFAGYSASKFALRGFSIALRREWKQRGIGVTYAAPRATHTDAAIAFQDLIAQTKMSLDPPERVARRIWQGVSKERDTVSPPGLEPLYAFIQHVFPRLIDQALARQELSAAANH